MDKARKFQLTIAFLMLLVTIVVGLIASPIFISWYNRPVIVINIKEFQLPHVYNEIILKEKLQDIPRISIIE